MATVTTTLSLNSAVTESFFRLLSRERLSRRIYPTRDGASWDVFEYIGLFYNPKRKHAKNGMQSPCDYENRPRKLTQAGVQETRGRST